MSERGGLIAGRLGALAATSPFCPSFFDPDGGGDAGGATRHPGEERGGVPKHGGRFGAY